MKGAFTTKNNQAGLKCNHLSAELMMKKEFFNNRKNFFKTHPIFQLSSDVNEICKPFFDAYNVNYLDYIRVYDNQSVIGLVSDAVWLEHFFKKNYVFGGTVKKSGKHLWQTYNSELLLHDARVYFNHDNGISIFNKKENYVEYFDIASPRGYNQILNLYLNNFEIIENFFKYFLEKSKKLISVVSSEPIIMPDKMRGSLIKEPEIEDITNMSFLNTTARKKFIKNKLTSRENDCMFCLLHGMTIKETAKTLNLSPRTVEHHLNNAKNKLGCHYRSDLIKKYISLLGLKSLSDIEKSFN